MPFTPFHLGPGAAFKAIGGRRFSFMVFGGSQVLMDVEPLVAIVRGWPILHGVTHTILGALVIGMVAGAIGRPIGELILNLLRIPHCPITWPVSFLSALVGACSHIGLDAVMHRDMDPFWPIAAGNPLLGLLSVEDLHVLCLAAGLLGVVIIAGRAFFSQFQRSATRSGRGRLRRGAPPG
jgi:uncharacterized membrane protein YeaQ/YmgE (transglycosylase-associated protein family)